MSTVLLVEFLEKLVELLRNEVFNFLGHDVYLLGDFGGVLGRFFLNFAEVESDLLLSGAVATLANDGAVVRLSTSVPGEDVGSAGWDICQGIRGCDGKEMTLEFLWRDVGHGVS